MSIALKQRARVAWRLRGKISKVSKAQRLVMGWASTSTEGGRLVVDHDKDRITPDELEKALHRSMEQTERIQYGDQHTRIGVGTLVEAFVKTSEKCKAMGLPDNGHSGLWVGFRVTDDEMWAKVLKGERPEFSIGGEADRVPAPDQPGAFDLVDIVIKEISGVDAGAGINVPVLITKRRGSGSGEQEDVLKLHKRAKKLQKLLAGVLKAANDGDEDAIALLEKINDHAEEVSKELNLADLAEIQSKLTPDEWAMVLEAIQSGVPLAGTPEPAAVEAGLDPAAGMPPAPVGQGMDPMAPKGRKKTSKEKDTVEDDDLTPEQIAKAKEKELRDELAKSRERIARLEKSDKLAKARLVVSKEMGSLPGDQEMHAEAIVALEGAIEADGKLVAFPVDVAKHVKATLVKAATAVKISGLTKSFGSGGESPPEPGTESDAGLTKAEARAELNKRAAALRKANPKLSEVSAWAEACRLNNTLYMITNAQD